MKAKQKERNKVRAHRESDFNRDGLWDRAVIQLKSVELHRTLTLRFFLVSDE